MDGGDLQEKLLEVDETRAEEELTLWRKVWVENKKMWVVAAPAIFTRASTFGINIISQAFIGHIGSTDLAAFAFVFTVIIRFVNGILLGMASALETLCGQAFGAKQYEMLGVYLQRSWIVLTLTSICILPIFIFTTPIMEGLGQAESVSIVAGKVSLWAIAVMFSFIASLTCQMFLQTQSKNVIIAYLAAISISVHIFLSWLLTVKNKLGLTGAMISTIIAYWIPNLGQLLFIFCGGCPDTWKGFSFLAFKDLWPVIKLSLSSGIMICLEFWYNTALIFLTGYMKNAEVAIDAISICLNINGWEMMIAFGFMAASGVRVSNELGRGNAKAAKFSVIITVLTSFIIGFCLFLFFLFLKERLAYIFTEDKEVIQAVGDLSPLLAVSILLNSVQPVLSGVAIGAGWQGVVAYVNIGCYYIIGLPVGLVLGYVFHFEVHGVWAGMLFGTFVQTVVLCILTYKTDWDNQVLISQNRVNKWATVDTQESDINTSVT
ncbi:Protein DETOXIFICATION [Quillaja saponaria]|uniref:Protein DETOXIFICATION n=1 Tax=Quillaja saponaria TaxID=32244 RepID=A0AAD7Q7V1_QUISA|nr:Protein DETOXIFICATION [Quillaja saponaria]